MYKLAICALLGMVSGVKFQQHHSVVQQRLAQNKATEGPPSWDDILAEMDDDMNG